MSALAGERADFDVLSIADANLVVCASLRIGAYMPQSILNYVDFCKKSR